MEATKLSRSFAVHPGVLLRILIEKHGIIATSLAPRLGLSYPEFDDILLGHRSLTEEHALLIEAAFGIEAELLMRLQVKFNLRKAQENESFRKKMDEVRNRKAFLTFIQ